MRSNQGFSLIELLIVVSIILIIAAIAIPNLLQARMSANESSAAASLRSLASAEATYYSSYPTIGYSPDLASLGGANPCTPSSTTACLIDNVLASASPGKGGKTGYQFLATGIMTAGSANNTVYVVGATPLNYNVSGQHDYCTTNDGGLHSQMGASGDLPAKDLPTCLAYPVAQ